MQNRRRYAPGRPVRFPLEPNTGGQGTPQPGATPLASEDYYNQGLKEAVPSTFDYRAIVPAPPSGSTTILIGDASNPAGAGAFNASLVPTGMVGEVDGIYPYVEGVAGPVNQPRIPGAGVLITWSIFVNNRPAGDYGTITQILAPWETATADRPLFYIGPGEILTCNVVNIDPGGIYRFLGIRIRGRIYEPRFRNKS